MRRQVSRVEQRKAQDIALTFADLKNLFAAHYSNLDVAGEIVFRVLPLLDLRAQEL